MLNPQVESALNALKESIRIGSLTKASHIDEDTLLCIKSTEGAYIQTFFRDLQPLEQEILKYRTIGETIRNLKIIAIFDVWDELVNEIKPVKKPIFE